METNSKKKILEVKDLSQHFKISKTKSNKAVNHVSFDVYEGEVFGIVGESGCGKTTTGRSIIKLYDITGGDVYFKGTRICAGIYDYKENIKNAKIEYHNNLKKLKKDGLLEENIDQVDDDFNIKNKNYLIKDTKGNVASTKFKGFITTSRKEYHEKLVLEKQKLKSIRDEKIKEELKKINQAKNDERNFEKKYAEKKILEIKEKYKDSSSHEAQKEIDKVKHEKLMTKMQMIFQDPIASLDPRMTVRDIIAEGLKVIGITDKEEIDKRVYEVLEKVGLVREHANRYPHEFSGGQRQRIGIARAIVMKPELIIADEPVSALDVSIQAQVINILNDLRKEMNLTIIFIAHDLSVVKYFSNRIAVMYYGEIVELATSDDLFKYPLHPYTKSLLSAIPLPDPIYEKDRKRISYNKLTAHDYSKEKPVLREIAPGHFVSCNTEEFNRYKKEIA